jgi:endonuclease/exonuclease/phosphatase family metal-dependent hydrolase
LIEKLLKGAGITLGVSALGLVAFYLWATAGSYPSEKYAEIVTDGDPNGVPARDTLTVISYNIGYLSGLANAAYKPEAGESAEVATGAAFFEQNLARAIATLQSLNPDLIALQEIDLDAKRSYHVNQVQALAKALGFPAWAITINWDKTYVPFPFWPPAAHFGKVVSGQAVLSRYPIQKNDRIVLEKVTHNPFFYNALYLDRLAQVTEIAIDGQPLILINLHLEAFDAPTRINQTQVVKDLAESYAENYPVLLLGDFNSAVNRAEEGDIKSIEILSQSSTFLPAVAPDQRGNPNQATYPSNRPAYKLDYIFYTPETLEMVSTRVITEAGQTSDHLPIAMTFKLKSKAGVP